MNDLVGLISQIPVSPGIDYQQVFFIYIAVTQKEEDVTDFIKIVNQQPDKKGGPMLTARDKWLMEGKFEGKLEGKLEGEINIINNFINKGIEWAVISDATGINPQKYENMKLEYQQLVSRATPQQAALTV